MGLRPVGKRLLRRKVPFRLPSSTKLPAKAAFFYTGMGGTEALYQEAAYTGLARGHYRERPTLSHALSVGTASGAVRAWKNTIQARQETSYAPFYPFFPFR